MNRWRSFPRLNRFWGQVLQLLFTCEGCSRISAFLMRISSSTWRTSTSLCEPSFSGTVAFICPMPSSITWKRLQIQAEDREQQTIDNRRQTADREATDHRPQTTEPVLLPSRLLDHSQPLAAHGDLSTLFATCPGSFMAGPEAPSFTSLRAVSWDLSSRVS